MAVFKGRGRYSIFLGRSRTLCGGLDILFGDLITTQKKIILSYPFKFMSGHLYFPNNLKDIKDHIQTDMISCKIFFQLMVTVFKEKLNLQLPLISEQIAENRFEALLEISDKFITKFNVFSYMILQFRLKTVWKISKPYCMTLKTVARQICLKGHSLCHKIFHKKALHEGTNFFG